MGKQHPLLPILSGTTGVIVYALFKNTILDFGFTYPISVVLFSLLISCILAFGAIGGILYSMKKYLDKNKTVVSLSKEELAHYFHEGKQWFKSTMKLLWILFLIVLVNVVFLLFVPNSGLLFFTNTGLAAALIILIWGVRPIKRKKIYKQFKRGFDNDKRELI